jgi:bacteriorhodopsin
VRRPPEELMPFVAAPLLAGTMALWLIAGAVYLVSPEGAHWIRDGLETVWRFFEVQPPDPIEE